MKAFTYLITHKSTGRRYYGVRYAAGCCVSDLGRTYFSHSKEIRRLIREEGLDSFLFEIRRMFEDITAAREWEKKVIRRIKAVSRSDWINRANSHAPPRYGPHSSETIEKMRAAKKGIAPSEATRLGHKLKMTGRTSNRKGVVLSEETRAVMKERVWIKGRKHSKENIEKIRQTSIGRPVSEEIRKKTSERMKLMWKQHKEENRNGTLVGHYNRY